MSQGALTQAKLYPTAVPDAQWSDVTSLWRSQVWVEDADEPWGEYQLSVRIGMGKAVQPRNEWHLK